jgi:hypothetical protein
MAVGIKEPLPVARHRYFQHRHAIPLLDLAGIIQVIGMQVVLPF